MAVDELTIRATLRDELSTPLRRLEEKVEDVADETDRLGDKAKRADRELGSLGTGVGKLGGLLRGPLAGGAAAGAVALGALTAAAGVGIGKMVSLASDAGETASKFGTVFSAQRAEMDAWVGELNAASGITTKSLQDAASTFGVFGKAAGVSQSDLSSFSQSTVQAGLDLASFYNAPVEDVFLALRSGLSGEAEPLRQFGVFLSDASLNAYALEEGIGKTVQEMSDAEKVQLRQAFILANLGDANGDLARTQDSLANTTKSLRGRLEEAGTTIGTAFLPYVESAAGRLDDWALGIMPKLEAEVAKVPGYVDAAAGAFRRISDLWASGASYGETTAAVFGLLGVESSAIEPIVNTLADVLGDVWTVLSDLLAPAIAEASALLPGFTSPLEVARTVLGFVADNANTLVPIVSALIVGFTAWKVATLALNAATIAGNALNFIRIASTGGLAAAQAAATTSTGALAAGTGLLNTIMALNPVVLVVAALVALAAGLYIAYQRSETFRNIVQSVWEWVQKAAGTVVDFLGKFTPLGALITQLGGLKGIADKIATAFGKVRDVVSKVIGFIKDLADKIKNLPGGGLVSKGLSVLGIGDTATPRGGGNLASTLASHAAISGMTGTRAGITNVGIGGFAGSDHHKGRALDLKGPGLNAYATALRQAGGYASWHGAGRGRHLHAAYGDTATPRARALAPMGGGGGGALILNGPLIGEVHASSDVDVELAARRALEAFVRDREERR